MTDDDFCETTSRVAALEVTEDAISERIKSKSQQMRTVHQQFRKSISPPTGWTKPVKVGSHD